MNEEAYKKLIETPMDPISYISDVGNFEMLYMTKGAMELFGMESEDEYRGKKCYQVLHGAKRPCSFCNNSRLMRNRSYSWMQYNERLRKWLLVNDRKLQAGGRTCRLEQIQEVPETQLWSADMTDNIRSELIIFQCLQALNSGKELDETVTAFLEMVGRYYRADRAYIIEFYHDRGLLSNTFEWCADGVVPAKETLQDIPLEVVDYWVERFERDGEFLINSVGCELDPESEDYRLLEMQDIYSLLAVPLYSDGEMVGFVGVDNPEQNLTQMNVLRVTSDFIVVELERRRMLGRLEKQSYTDGLTGVFNRNRYIETKESYYRDPPGSLGVIVVDINGLKLINDNLGHAAGDDVIISTANTLLSCLEHQVFRIGGDEFVALCPDCTREQLIEDISRLREAFSRETRFSVSIGMSWSDKPSDIRDHVHKADEVMYSEKQNFYHNALSAGLEVRNASASEVLREIDEGRYIVYYQPQVDMRDGSIIGVESLVRKLDDDGGIIPPGRFVPYLEAQNVLMHVDMHVLETVLAEQRRLQDRGIFVRMSVNFSRTTLLMPDFAAKILEVFRRYGVSAEWITLEVTETISTISRPLLSELLLSIRRAGLRISLDDFGTQYSNMAILADVHFDEIKFDKSLVDDLTRNPRNRIIVKKLVEMCRELQDVSIIAEGIETQEQVKLLQKYSCNFAQGYLFHRPMPIEQLTELLSGNTNLGFSEE